MFLESLEKVEQFENPVLKLGLVKYELPLKGIIVPAYCRTLQTGG